MAEDAEELKKHIGYLPENNPLYEDVPIMDYLKFVAELQGIPSKEIPQRIEDIIRKVGLNMEKHKKIFELSNGISKEWGLAQALIHDPDILVLDEPTSGLDPNQIIEIRKLIRDLGKEKTVILSTHILPEVEAIADRILIINRGKIVANGTAESLRSQAQSNEVLKIGIDGGETNAVFEALKSLESVALVDFANRENNLFMVESEAEASSKKDIFNLCVEKKWFLTELTPIERKLEDIFRQLTLN